MNMRLSILAFFATVALTSPGIIDKLLDEAGDLDADLELPGGLKFGLGTK